jgi:hypothetical protein
LTREAGDYAFGKLGHGAITAAIAEAQTSGALVPHPISIGTEFAGFTTPSGIETERTMLRNVEAAGRGAASPACRADRRRARGRAGRAAIGAGRFHLDQPGAARPSTC